MHKKTKQIHKKTCQNHRLVNSKLELPSSSLTVTSLLHELEALILTQAPTPSDFFKFLMNSCRTKSLINAFQQEVLLGNEW